MTVRNYSNLARPVALGADVGASDGVWQVATTAGYPPAPFTLGIERGTANEEMALCTAKDSVSFTVTRGFDSTPNVGHLAGAAIEHVTGAIDYAEANGHINNDLLHLVQCTSATRPSSPSIGQEIWETDTRMKMRYVAAGVWTTDRILERWWTYSADNLRSTSTVQIFDSGNFQANSSGWPGAGLTPSGAVNYPFLMEIKLLGHADTDVANADVNLFIESPSGTNIEQPFVGGTQQTALIPTKFTSVLDVGWRIFWTPGVPNFVVRYNIDQPGVGLYLRLAIQARIVPVF